MRCEKNCVDIKNGSLAAGKPKFRKFVDRIFCERKKRKLNRVRKQPISAQSDGFEREISRSLKTALDRNWVFFENLCAFSISSSMFAERHTFTHHLSGCLKMLKYGKYGCKRNLWEFKVLFRGTSPLYRSAGLCCGFVGWEIWSQAPLDKVISETLSGSNPHNLFLIHDRPPP